MSVSRRSAIVAMGTGLLGLISPRGGVTFANPIDAVIKALGIQRFLNRP